MSLLLRRSTLILPINVPRFVERAHLRGADAVMLDLEDAVPETEKTAARRLARETIPLVARGGAEVLVRVNHVAGLLAEDVEASVHPGLTGICFPKAESADEIHQLDAHLSDLERRRGLAPGCVELAVLIETPRGVLNLESIASASPRVRTISLGPEDYCLALGVEPSADGMELLYGVSKVITVCKALGQVPLGLLGSIAGFRDLAAFERAAARARDLGCMGASCIHPDQVSEVNAIFSPSAAEVEWSRKVVQAFEAAEAAGSASIQLEGKFIDYPIVYRARRVLETIARITARA